MRAATMGCFGLVRKSTKSTAGQRVIALASSAVALLRQRFMGGRPSRSAGVSRHSRWLSRYQQQHTRSPARSSGQRRGARVDHHTHLRKTTATILDEAGLSARAVANQLGHSRPSMTQDVYLGRRVKAPEAAAALEQALADAMDEKRD
ncbi:MAG: tyrosine-type recombinase/integrase [Propionibacteriales bacterium]|nr:tyrosine-type recombinase/integrase [Propionibacteriales bacterium]